MPKSKSTELNNDVEPAPKEILDDEEEKVLDPDLILADPLVEVEEEEDDEATALLDDDEVDPFKDKWEE